MTACEKQLAVALVRVWDLAMESDDRSDQLAEIAEVVAEALADVPISYATTEVEITV